MWAKVQGAILSTDGWKLDPCQLAEDGTLTNCPDCGSKLAEYNEATIRHTCDCGSEFDIWRSKCGAKQLVMTRAIFSWSGHYLKSHSVG